MDELVWSIGEMTLTGENRKTLEKKRVPVPLTNPKHFHIRFKAFNQLHPPVTCFILNNLTHKGNYVNRSTVEPRLSEIKRADPISDKQYFG
jgi:hypothetical protein